MSHANDHIYRFIAKIGGLPEQEVQFIINTEMLTQYAPGSHPMPGQRRALKAIRDSDDYPVLFFLDKDKHLKVAYRNPKHAIGQTSWREAVISAALLEEHFQNRPDPYVVRFDLGQSNAGETTLFVEIFDPADNRSHFFTSKTIPHRIDENWLPTLKSFQPRGHLAGNCKRISIGLSALPGSTLHAPLEAVFLQDAASHESKLYHWVPAALGDEGWRAFTVTGAEGAIVDMQCGHAPLGWGVFTLWQIGERRALFFTCLVASNGALIQETLPLTVPHGGVLCIHACLSHHTGLTDLYMGGDRIWVHKAFHLERGREATALTHPNHSADIQKITAAANESTVSIVALGVDGALYRIERPVQLGALGLSLTEHAYHAPIPIHRHVSDFTLARAWQNQAESLILQTNDQELLRLEHGATGWHEQNIPLPIAKKLEEITSYTVNISTETHDRNHLFSEDLETFKPIRFFLSCTDTAEVRVNGEHKRVGPDSRTLIHPGPNGRVSIIMQISGPIAPEFQLSTPYAAKVMTISPTQKLKQRFHGYTTKSDMLHDLVDQQGRSIIPEQRQGKLQQAFHSSRVLQRIDHHINQRLSDVNTALPNDLPTLWGGDSNGLFWEGEIAMNQFGPGEFDWFGDAIRGVFSDIGRWLRDVVGKTAKYIVKLINGAWHFAIKIGEQAFRFVLETSRHVLHAFQFLLEHLLLIPTRKLFDWLKFLFGWDDVITVYKVFANAAYQNMSYGIAKLDDFGNGAASWLQNAEKHIDDFLKTVLRDRRWGINVFDDKQNGRQFEPREAKAAKIQLDATPKGQFGADLLHRSGLLSMDAATGAYTSVAFQEHRMAAIFQDILASMDEHFERAHNKVQTWFADFWESLKAFLIALVTAFQNGRLLIHEILHGIQILAKKIFQAARASVEVAVFLAKGIVEGTQAILFDPLDLPLITPLFDKLIKQEGHTLLPQHRLNLINGFMFLLAIPATHSFKLLANRKPFTDEAGQSHLHQLDEMDHQQLFTKLSDNSLTPRAYKDYTLISRFLSNGFTAIESGMMPIAALTDNYVPPALNLPLDLGRLATSTPIGPFSLGNFGGWVGNWIFLGANMFSVAFPGKPGKVTSILKLLFAIGHKVIYQGISTVEQLDQIGNPRFPDERHRVLHIINTLWNNNDMFCKGVGTALYQCAALDDEPETKSLFLIAGSGTVARADLLEFARAGFMTLADLGPLGMFPIPEAE